MVATFVVVGQWQGSSSSRAMRLIDGAQAISDDLPAGATTTVEIPLEAGDAQGTAVHRLSSVALIRDRLTHTLRETAGPVIIIGGDCGSELGAISHAIGEATAEVAVLWFDAHPDLNTPQSSLSGAFHGMVLRTLLGEGPEQLVPAVTLQPSQVVLVGARAVDAGEDSYITEHGIRCITVEKMNADSVIAAVEATGAGRVYVHIDLDVLDPVDCAGLGFPEPFGVRATALVDTLKGVLGRFPLAGAGITEFAPSSPAEAADDVPTILRIIAALSGRK
ncbi:MAG: arginase family protein [Rhodoglobus sp.]